ncbi:DUF4493 domain-containing protein, partial [Xanthovirga aplysinae]|uniref:DUF4493 domain-containing protein n=1 Tax=Xanthovirga aplysinae TaxID=2529853 RepID=UPI0012BB8A97
EEIQEQEEIKTGKLSVDFSIDDESIINLDDYELTIFSSEGEAVKTFEHANDFPSEFDLDEGTYYLMAESKKPVTSSFELPEFSGNSDLFTIQTDQKQEIPLVWTNESAMVKVEYTEGYREVFEMDYEYSVTISALDMEGAELEYAKNELRYGYLKPSNNFKIELSRRGKSEAEDSYVKSNSPYSFQAGKQYKVIFDFGRLNNSIQEATTISIVEE